ncbi:MAG: hypothetical protein HXX08_22090 [Chloroflexi bacterium]|uniref:Uncharacterized protein n=1 Tax=Candidatus Chlorohelix allophototropha TaxID=3003348 RepID=A0A8T7M8R7_9CHLR|nr:hypothetical protein [Chloroflexota bacterium]WJW68489.1 hypothetical protein OZ401_004102 [Chloroflexota bacterium L227-S17]
MPSGMGIIGLGRNGRQTLKFRVVTPPDAVLTLAAFGLIDPLKAAYFQLFDIYQHYKFNFRFANPVAIPVSHDTDQALSCANSRLKTKDKCTLL